MRSPNETFPDPKNRGEWAEMRFMARAAEQGFRVSKPWGDSARYDFAVEENGRFLRIQVKSTIYRSGSGYSCSIHHAGTSGSRYTAEQVDFFAAYVIPEDVWYILPAETAVAVNGHVYLSPKNAKQRYANYKEAWHLLHEAVAKKDESVPQASPEDEICAPPPVADADAEPGEIGELRGEVEPVAAVGFDHDLLRRRFAGCFERILKRQ
jgi:hypothetical protein